MTAEAAAEIRWDLLEAEPPTGTRLKARPAVPSRSQEVQIAVDAAIRRHILVRVPEEEPKSFGERYSRGISVQSVVMTSDDAGGDVTFVEISCLDRAGHAALDTVALELVDAVTNQSGVGRVRQVQSVLAKWRKFWSGIDRDLLSRELQLGLFGELWFLARWLIPAIGPEASVDGWRGPLGARNDFEFPGCAIEVKTSGRTDGAHQIHGLEQLLEPAGGSLFVFSLLVREEASATDSLVGLVSELRATLATDEAILARFESMLTAADFDDRHVAEYDKLRLRIRGQGLYRVADGFPRLVPPSIVGGVPSGVSNVTYELRLDGAARWLVAQEPSTGANAIGAVFGGA